MTEAEFDRLFEEYWKREYPVVRQTSEDPRHPAADIIQDVHEMIRLQLMLREYARQAQNTSISRTKKDTLGRHFEAMGVDPRSIEFDRKR